ncbi:MAG: deoxyribonuclease IV, partial [Oscillospiraceae bacterium]|nr:deoxyribonuclease IV [Oscillospiraceae bacterium]
MLNIGAHLSISKGFLACGKQATEIGANTFQFFTRNPRGGKAKDIDKKDTDALIVYMRENNFSKILAHAPYTLNPCSAAEKTREFALQTMADDLRRMEHLPNNLYNFHPGSHVGQGIDKGIELITNQLNTVLFPEMTTTVLLETMAGKGSEVGSRFEELKRIIDGVELKEKMGVCLDTCHVFDGGYDIVNSLEEVLEEFDKVI